MLLIKYRFQPVRRYSFLFLFSIFSFLKLFSQPVISNVAPSAGNIGTTVIINGTGFSTTVSDNIVLFNTIRATVTMAMPNSLTVIVPYGATYGSITITVQNRTALSSQPFFVTFTSCPVLNAESFSQKTDFVTGSTPQSICTGDIDMDGSPDLISSNSSSSTISILKNNGIGGNISFSPKIDVATGYYPYKVILGDLDGDAKPEIIVANLALSTISVFRNLSLPGAISFATKVDFITGSSPVDIAISDADGDGKIDITIANSNAYTVSVLRNTSSGSTLSFAPKVDYTTGSLRPKSLSAGDLDGDGKPDIAVASFNYNHDSISVFKNTSIPGALSFSSRINFPNEGGGSSLSIGDMDGDSYPDLAVTNATFNRVSILRNAGAAGSIVFEPKVDFTSGNMPQGLCIGDFDGDGRPDLAFVTIGTNTVSVLKNTSSAGIVMFAAKVDYATGSNPASTVVADFDLNGRPDLAVAYSFGSSISVILKTASQKILLVDSSKTANNTITGLCSINNTDWTNACNSLQTALNAAQEGDQIWVAKGSYFPSQDSAGNPNPADPHSITFVMKSGVKVYGGFSGIETDLAQRNGSLNKTILNGQISATGAGSKVTNVVWFSQAKNTTVLNGFTITNGQAADSFRGGGIYLNESSPVISNCIVTGNSSADYGGGIYIKHSSPTLVNCSVYDNIARYGGGIANNNASPVIINCTVVKNAAGNAGGGIHNQAASPTISNSIVWGNTGLNNIPDNITSSSSTPVVTYSIVGLASGVFSGTGNKNTTPLFVDAANENFALIRGSAAVTGGSLNAYPSNAPSIDLAGNPRIENGTISIGAYQGGKNPLLNALEVIYINKNVGTIFGNGRSWASAYSNLSDALLVSNNNHVSALWVAKGSYSPTNDSSAVSNPSIASNLTFGIKRSIQLLGGFSGNETNLNQRNVLANQTILDGLVNSNGYSTKVSSVVYISNADSVITLDGFTITNGTGNYSTQGGGAISSNKSDITVNNCRVINNMGSAIFNMYGSMKITNCYFSGNSGQYGGAIYNLKTTATVISDCSFINNIPTGSYAYGGAIANDYSSVTILRCYFNNNRAISDGGAIYNSSSTSTIMNCRFINNQTSIGGRGGAVSNLYSPNTIFINCIFVKNFAQSGGAVFNNSSTSKFINCSLTDNSAYNGGSILNGGTSTTTIRNSINWGNVGLADRNGDNVYDLNTYSPVGNFSIQHSIIGYNNGVYPGTGNLNTDPKFTDTANAIVKLLSNSPAIEAGDNNAYTGILNSDRDVEGMPRLSGTRIDMGATEFSISVCAGGVATVTSSITGAAYQWQIDTGSGFTNLSDNSNVNGTSNSVLQLNNVPSSWNDYQFRCLVSGNYSTVLTLKTYNQWTGIVSAAWENASNWSCNVVPDNNTNVVINSGNVEINSNAICHTLTLSSSVSVTAHTGAILTITH